MSELRADYPIIFHAIFRGHGSGSKYLSSSGYKGDKLYLDFFLQFKILSIGIVG